MYVFSKFKIEDYAGRDICSLEKMKESYQKLQVELQDSHRRNLAKFGRSEKPDEGIMRLVVSVEPKEFEKANAFLKEGEGVFVPLCIIKNLERLFKSIETIIIDKERLSKQMGGTEEMEKNIIEEIKQNIMPSNDIEQFGATRISPAAVRLAEDTRENTQLILQMFFDKKGGGRKYRIIEKVDNIEYGIYSKNAYFTPWEIANATSKIEVYIYNMQGDYRDKINNILSALKMVEEGRVLEISERIALNNEVYTTEEIIEKIKAFLMVNPLDNRFDVFDINNEISIGIVGRDRKSAYQNFADIIMEVAPENNAKTFKDECFSKNLFQTDGNSDCKDCQRTIPKNQCIQKGIRGDKMYDIKYGDEFIAEYMKLREEALSKKQEERILS